MKFRNRIPEKILESNINLDGFITVLDKVSEYKTQMVDTHALYYKSIVSGDKSWIKKRLEDYGFPNVPYTIPKECMDAMLLNSRNIMSLKGSDLGLCFFLWSLTFGDIDIDWSLFFPATQVLFLTEFGSKGHLLATDPNSTRYVNFLTDSEKDVGSQKLSINIKTPYYNNAIIKGYIIENIRKFINFTDSSFELTLTLEEGPYFIKEEPYWYFRNTHDQGIDTVDSPGIGLMGVEGDFIIR